jgi:hypothetical protein
MPGGRLAAQSSMEVRRLSINTPGVEMAPAFYHNGLVFCSDRKNEVLVSYTDLRDQRMLNLYQADQRRPGRFENAHLFSKDLTTFLNEGPASFSADYKTVYFTRTIDVSMGQRNKQREDTTFGIFSATFRNGVWSDITPFRFNRPEYNTGYPCLSADQKQLFFCSDAPGGSGGYDIWVATWENGRWGQPRNLGSLVNTAANEVFPFLHRSGRLYFASRGHNGRGDLDLYYTVEKDGTWQKPIPMAAPYNSPSDDYGLILNPAMDTGYFVSERSSDPDIFLVSSTLPVFTDCKPQEENDYCFVFYEPNNNDLDTNAFAFEWDLGDGTRVRQMQVEHCFSKPGTYLVQLNVIDKVTGEVSLNQASDSFLVEDIEQPYITAPEAVEAGAQLNADGAGTFLKDFAIGGYYWDFGDGSRASGKNTTHRYDFPGTYDIQLGVLEQVSGRNTQARKVCSVRRILVTAPPGQ